MLLVFIMAGTFCLHLGNFDSYDDMLDLIKICLSRSLLTWVGDLVHRRLGGAPGATLVSLMPVARRSTSYCRVGAPLTAYKCVCVRAHACAGMCVCTGTCMCMCVHKCICVHAQACVYTGACTCVCACVCTGICTVCVCLGVCVCMCVQRYMGGVCAQVYAWCVCVAVCVHVHVRAQMYG